MHYRGLVKKRLVPVEIAGAVPEAGTMITRDGKEAGVLRSAVAGNGADAQSSLGLALLRLEALEDGDAQLLAGQASVTPRKPAWAKFSTGRSLEQTRVGRNRQKIGRASGRERVC